MWLLASLLQKAVRRGDLTVARRAGHQLLHADPNRLWRRLMVVALEDIGLGDPEAAASLVGLAAVPETRRLFANPEEALDVALRLACDAIKDRTGDHFGSIAREMISAPHSLTLASTNARLAVLLSSYLPWRRRLRAALLLGEDEAPAAQRLAAYEPLSEGFRALGVPGVLMDACELYRYKARDPLPLFVPLGFGLWLSQGASRATITHSVPPSEAIGGIPDYAFDPLHTRLGRRAVDLWLRSYLQRPPFETRQIAAALWNLESGVCSKTLDWGLGQEIAEQAWGADLIAVGVPAGRHEALKVWVLQERSVLICARKAAWESALRATAHGQEGLPLARAAE